MSNLITVMIPIYNSDKYLNRCIDSILGQTYSKLEIILVDDGSTDSSSRICDEYASIDERVKVIHKPNGGLKSARIAGIVAATGEWLAFIDSDDFIESDTIEKLYRKTVANADCDIVVGGYVEDFNGKIKNLFSPGDEKIMDCNEALYNMFDCKLYNWSLCDKLYRHSLFDDDVLSKWPQSYGEDTYINWTVFRKSRTIVYTPIYGYHYWMHSDSMTHKYFSSQRIDYIRIYDEIVKELVKNNQEELSYVVMRTALNSCLPILYTAEEEYDKYNSEILYGLECMKEYASNLDANKSDYYSAFLKKIFDRVILTKEEIQRNINTRNEEIKNFANGESIYIYGAGKISEEISNIAYGLNINIEGIVVSGIKDDMTGYGHNKLICINELIDKKIKSKIILAMNEKNTKEVIPNLDKYDFFECFDAGCYSVFY